MKLFIITFFVCIFTLAGFAQNQDRRDRIKSLKIAFITEKLNLTQTEAQQFWPIYNAFEDANVQLRKETRMERADFNIDNLTDAEANNILDSMLNSETEKLELRKKFLKDLKTVLPAKKIILLKLTEDQFNRRMLQEMQKRREEYRNKKN